MEFAFFVLVLITKLLLFKGGPRCNNYPAGQAAVGFFFPPPLTFVYLNYFASFTSWFECISIFLGFPLIQSALCERVVSKNMKFSPENSQCIVLFKMNTEKHGAE